MRKWFVGTMPEKIDEALLKGGYLKKMEEIARAVERVLNGEDRGSDRKIGFALLVFPFGTTRCSYISNGANRADVVALMKQQIALLEGDPPPGHAR